MSSNILTGFRHDCNGCNCCCLKKYMDLIHAALTFRWPDGTTSGFSVDLGKFLKGCPKILGQPCPAVFTPCAWQWKAPRPDGCCGTPGALCGDVSFDVVYISDPGPPVVYNRQTYYLTELTLSCVVVAGEDGNDPGTCLKHDCGSAYGWLAYLKAVCSCAPYVSGDPDPCDPITSPPFERWYNLFDPSTAVEHPVDCINYKCCPSFSLAMWDRIWDPSATMPVDPYPSLAGGDHIEALFTGEPTCYPVPDGSPH